jgi:predicted transcriptional regulator
MNSRTTASVLRAIADDKSMKTFLIISRTNGIDGLTLRWQAKLTRKQFYSRLARMKEAGLVRKKSGKYTLTTFGKVVLCLHGTIEKAHSDFSSKQTT